MVYHMEHPVDGLGADGHFKWLDGPGIPPILTLSWRREVKSSDVGSIARVDSELRYSKRLTRTDGLIDIECVSLIPVVSARFKALVEQFEPGVHFFKPIRMEMVSGEPFDGEHYIFFAQQAADFWLTKMSQTRWTYQSDDPESKDYWPPYLDSTQLRMHKYERNPRSC